MELEGLAPTATARRLHDLGPSGDIGMTWDNERRNAGQIAALCALIAVPLTLPTAQPDTPTIAECQSIEDDAFRLACYDRIAEPASPAGKDAAPPAADEPPGANSRPREQGPARSAGRPAGNDAPAPSPQPESDSVAADERPGAVSPASDEPNDEPKGLNDEIGRETVRGRNDDRADLSVRGRVVDCDEGRSGKYVFYFDNGQVWLQKDNKRLSWKECEFDVTISEDLFGYKMLRDDDDRAVRIERFR